MVALFLWYFFQITKGGFIDGKGAADGLWMARMKTLVFWLYKYKRTRKAKNRLLSIGIRALQGNLLDVV